MSFKSNKQRAFFFGEKSGKPPKSQVNPLVIQQHPSNMPPTPVTPDQVKIPGAPKVPKFPKMKKMFGV